MNAYNLSFAIFQEGIGRIKCHSLIFSYVFPSRIEWENEESQRFASRSSRNPEVVDIATADLIAVSNFFCDTQRDWPFIKVRYQFIA